jgi:hypothetical protein
LCEHQRHCDDASGGGEDEEGVTDGLHAPGRCNSGAVGARVP